ncbi:MAG: GHKL domain-containing protein [Lachnospiraceae bacterium]|nr:GHKL domain-containing protein [Lachnospiraceae bacterium]
MNVMLPDIPRFYTALAEWLACLQCILEMRRVLKGWKFNVLSGVILVTLSAFLILTKNADTFWWLPFMAIAIAIMFFYIYYSCDINKKDAGYCCVRAFIVAEFAASIEWQIHCYYTYIVGIDNIILQSVILIAVYAGIFLLIAYIYRKYMVRNDRLNITNQELLAAVLIGLAVFMMSNLGFVYSKTPFSGQYIMEIFNVRTLIDMGGVAILYAYHIKIFDMRTRYELDSVRNILHNQYVQYQQSQETLDLINYRYHDLKHHIIALRAENNPQKRNEYLDKMEEEIINYEAQNKTGNQVLDTLLTSKNLYCIQNDISFTCVADGNLLDFMDVMDICSIFGNALDNAIECEKQISDKEKRLIHVSVSSQKQFLIIRVENYYEGTLKYEHGLPVTTKKQAEFHGFGIKSIRYTVHKYEGEVDVSVKDNWFILNILIPIQEHSKQ